MCISQRKKQHELPARIARAPVTFHLKAQLASRGDSTKDASAPWPDGDETIIELGVLTIDKSVPDSLEAQKKLLFLPGNLVEGIEPSDDPLIGVRDGAYAVSFPRRNPFCKVRRLRRGLSLLARDHG